MAMVQMRLLKLVSAKPLMTSKKRMACHKLYCLVMQDVIQPMNSFTSKSMEIGTQTTGRETSQTLLFPEISLQSTSRHQGKKSRSTQCGLNLNLKLLQREVLQNKGYLNKVVKVLMTQQ